VCLLLKFSIIVAFHRCLQVWENYFHCIFWYFWLLYCCFPIR